MANFRIKKIDFGILLAHDNIYIDNAGENNYVLEDGYSFRWLKIEDHKKFGVLVAGRKKGKRVKQDYSRMDITVGGECLGNLQNETVKEYKRKIERIFRYLYDEYGISVDAENIRFSEMEINCTFEVESEFYKYHRVLSLMMYNLPNYYRKLGMLQGVNKKKRRVEAETFYRGNASMEVKIYDKKKQLEEKKGVMLNENVMRIELILKKTQKIRESFGSARVADMTDEKINQFFCNQFDRLFVRPYIKWQSENGKQLRALIKKHKENDQYQWKANLFRECSNREQIDQIPVLLDVKDLLRQLKPLEHNGHFSRIEKAILKECELNAVYLESDGDKIEEIFAKVQEAYSRYMEQTSAPVEQCTTIAGDVA